MEIRDQEIKIQIKKLNFYYAAGNPAVKDINMSIAKNRVTSVIGPSGCGKTTLLRCLNRIHDLYPGNRYEGEIWMDGQDILQPETDLMLLRSNVGMVFQKPTPFPMSIFENITFGLRLNGVRGKDELAGRVEASLKAAALWDETKDKLHKSAQSLSGGQQQRLSIARAIALKPEVILMDEPCSALDPISTAKIEELIFQLKENYTIVIVTHNMQQAARVSDYAGFFLLGELIEFNKTEKIFEAPKDKRTEDYITGRFG